MFEQQNNEEQQQEQHGKQKTHQHYYGYNMVDSDGLPQQTTMQASYEPASKKLEHQHQHEKLQQQHNKEKQQQNGKQNASEGVEAGHAPDDDSSTKHEHYASGYNMVDSDGLPQQTTMQASYEPAAKKLEHQQQHEQLQQHNKEQQQHGEQSAPEDSEAGHVTDSSPKHKHYASGYNMVDSDGLPQQTTMQASYEPAGKKLEHQQQHEQLQEHGKKIASENYETPSAHSQQHYASGYNMVDSDGLPQQTTMQASYEPAAKKLEHQHKHEQLQQHGRHKAPEDYEKSAPYSHKHYASGYNMVDSDGLPQQTTMQASYEPVGKKLEHQQQHEQLQQYGKQKEPEGSHKQTPHIHQHYASGYNMVDSDGLPQQTTMQASYETAGKKLEHQQQHEQLQDNKQQQEEEDKMAQNKAGDTSYGGIDAIRDGVDAVSMSGRRHYTDSQQQARDNIRLERDTLSDTERQSALEAAESKFKELIDEINHMPMGSETLRARTRKGEIEKELKSLETDIRVFSKTKD